VRQLAALAQRVDRGSRDRQPLRYLAHGQERPAPPWMAWNFARSATGTRTTGAPMRVATVPTGEPARSRRGWQAGGGVTPIPPPPQLAEGPSSRTATMRMRPSPEGGRLSQPRKYVCAVCNHVYDPVEGDPPANIPPGTPFEALPKGWICPDCGASKADFEPVDP